MDIFKGIALSMHMGLSDSYNSVHPHIGIEQDGFIAGAYYNSEYKISTYAGYKFDLGYNSTVELGAVTGYSSGDILPMLKYNYKQFFISPAYEPLTDNVGAVVGIDWRF